MRRHPRRTEAVLVGLFFAALAALFMGPILWHFDSAVHGFWGDGTGGLIWLNGLGLGPFGGFSDAVIYPYGDNLFRPEFITAFLFIVPFWILTKLFGAVVAWNTIIFVSFWLCGLTMYYLAKRVSRSRMAALWAGVAFTFLPMHQYKAFGHIAYVMTFVFVLVFWQVLNFLEKPSKRNAVMLGLAFAAPFYIDGYYVLFALLLVGLPLVYMLVRALCQLNKKTVEQFKSLLLSGVIFAGTAAVALLPVIYTKLVYGAQIAGNLAMARGDFMSNVMVYTARWYDFVIPIETHPVFGAWATAFRVAHNHGSNTSEHTLYLGFVVIALAGFATYFVLCRAWFKPAKAKPRKTVDLPVRRQTLVVMAIIAVVAFLISLPPYFHLFGHRIPMPSGVISVLVQYWRVYARLIFIIHLALVLIGTVGLAILLKRMRSRVLGIGLVVLLIVVTFFEYLSFNPFKRQDIWYYDKLSSANQWLAGQKDIKAIAVYPLVDQPNGLASLYTTEQRVHGKKMVNSGTISAKAARLRASIGGLNDLQTLGVLKALGVQAVMTHEVLHDREVMNLRLVYSANEAPAGYAADVDIYRIKDSVKPARYALLAAEGTKDVTDPYLHSQHYVNVDNKVALQVMALPGITEDPTAKHRIRFDLVATGAYRKSDLMVMQGDRVLDVIRTDAGKQLTLEYGVTEGEPVRMFSAGPILLDTIYLQNLQVIE